MFPTIAFVPFRVKMIGRRIRLHFHHSLFSRAKPKQKGPRFLATLTASHSSFPRRAGI